MTSAPLLQELQTARDLVLALVEPLDDAALRRQAHPDLSPPGWHLGHCCYTECYWLQEVVANDNRHTGPVAQLYTPALTGRDRRGAALPDKRSLLAWVADMQACNSALLESGLAVITGHRLMQDDYLLHFLIQHYSQHYETLLMISQQNALAREWGDHRVGAPVQPAFGEVETVAIEPGHYRVGGRAPFACDNELPVQQATLGPCRMARRPVSNAQYLAFMQDGGYRDVRQWCAAGREWLQQQSWHAPDHWRHDPDGNWYGIGVRGAYDLDDDDVLTGISWYEADAFARWAGARLPHEHQWEVACRLHRLELTGRTWEWCGNSFYPYDGFRAFPYEGYSQSWFDGRHYTLRGGSLHTRPAVKRPSFRNFHEPHKRYIFAGLRLVW